MKNEDLAKTLFKAFKKSKEYERLFWDVYNHGKPITPKELQEKYGYNKRVFQRLKYYINKQIFIKKKIGKMATYEINPILRIPKIDQHFFFEKLKEKEKGILYGDLGELKSIGPGVRYFHNNHTVYGLPIWKKLSEYQFQIFTSILKRIDDAFDDLKELKEIYEINKRYKQKERVMAKLCLKYLLYHFVSSLEEFLEMDAHNEKSYRFIMDLVKEACRLGKKHKLKLCMDENSPYPEKSFLRHFLNPALLMNNIEEEITLHTIADFYNKLYGLRQKGKWFFQTNKKYVCYEEELEDYLTMESYEKLRRWEKIFAKNKEREKLAILSTPSIEQMKELMNIKTCLGYRVNRVYKALLIKPKNKASKIENMITVYSLILPALTPKGFRNAIEEREFKNSQILKKWFSKKETNFMIGLIKNYGDRFPGFYPLEEIIWSEAFSPEPFGEKKYKLWFKEDWERKIKILFKDLKKRERFSFKDVMSLVNKIFEEENGENRRGIAMYIMRKMLRTCES